jgi:hypothetical protein
MKRILAIALFFVCALPVYAQNPISLETRHCQKYTTRKFPAFWQKQLTAKGLAACMADPSTLYGVAYTHNLRTNGGDDFFNAQLFGTSAAGAQSNYLAITSTVITPGVGDTTLSGELTTNGLARKQATVSHTTGASQTVLAATWTYNGAAGTVTINGVGLFTASSAGTMTHVASVASAPTVTNNGDTVTINYTQNY